MWVLWGSIRLDARCPQVLFLAMEMLRGVAVRLVRLLGGKNVGRGALNGKYDRNGNGLVDVGKVAVAAEGEVEERIPPPAAAGNGRQFFTGLQSEVVVSGLKVTQFFSPKNVPRPCSTGGTRWKIEVSFFPKKIPQVVLDGRDAVENRRRLERVVIF